jgi:hypothetical protein
VFLRELSGGENSIVVEVEGALDSGDALDSVVTIGSSILDNASLFIPEYVFSSSLRMPFRCAAVVSPSLAARLLRDIDRRQGGPCRVLFSVIERALSDEYAQALARTPGTPVVTHASHVLAWLSIDDDAEWAGIAVAAAI